MQKLNLLFTFFTFLINVVNSENVLSEENIIKALFNGTHSQKTRPVNSVLKHGAVVVVINIYVRSIDKVDDINGEFDVQLTFRQQWLDERLIYSRGNYNVPRYINLVNPESSTWLPDTFFSNSKEEHYHNLMVRNEYFRVHPNGEIAHSTRISLKLSCPMSFRYFPFDEQTCSIRMESYGHTTSDIIYKWKKSDPVQVTSDLYLPTFNLYQYTIDYCDSATNTGSYSCLRVDFGFKRILTGYLRNVYIPCTMMVTIACLSLWIDPRSLLVRIGLVAGTLFLCATLIFVVNQTFPATSYTKAVDIWTGVCLTFIFGVFVESIVVQHLAKRENDKKPHTTEGRVGHVEINVLLNDSRSQHENKWIQKIFCGANSVSKKIDSVSRVAFPVAFLFFVSIYIQTFYYRPSQFKD